MYEGMVRGRCMKGWWEVCGGGGSGGSGGGGGGGGGGGSGVSGVSGGGGSGVSGGGGSGRGYCPSMTCNTHLTASLMKL